MAGTHVQVDSDTCLEKMHAIHLCHDIVKHTIRYIPLIGPAGVAPHQLLTL